MAVIWGTPMPACGPGCVLMRPLTPGARLCTCRRKVLPEREMKARRRVEGIPVDSVTWSEIVGAGAKVGVDAARVEALARG